MVTRGQVWSYLAGSRQLRVLIVSNDEFNEAPDVQPWAVIIERSARPASTVAVPLAAGDPLAGATVLIPLVLRLTKTGLRENLGFVSNDTMNAVEYGLREFLVLP